MKLATATLIFRQIEDMLLNSTFLHQSKVGGGNHSRREISNAPLLVIALDYWVGQVADLAADKKWSESFNDIVGTADRLPLRLTIHLVPPDSEFIDLSKLPRDSDEYREAYSKMDRDGLDRYEEYKQHPGTEEHDREDARSFVDFLKTLQIHPSSAYWESVYSRLKLRLPEYDPDRLDSKDKLAVWQSLQALQKRTEETFNTVANSPKDKSPYGDTLGTLVAMAAVVLIGMSFATGSFVPAGIFIVIWGFVMWGRKNE